MSLNTNLKPEHLSFTKLQPKVKYIPIKGHWDRLYLYSKYLAKSKEQKALKQKELSLIKESKDCTFCPITHYSSYYKNKKDLAILNTSLAERQSAWEGIKAAKIQQIANDVQEKHYTECKFSPNITKNESYLLTKTMPTENIVLDPESFKYYLKRRNKFRIEKNKEMHRRQLTPGNGNIWKKKQTVIQEFKFETDKLTRNKSRCHINNNKSFNNTLGMTAGMTGITNTEGNNRVMGVKKNMSYTLIRTNANKEYDTDVNQYIKERDRLHSELLDLKL